MEQKLRVLLAHYDPDVLSVCDRQLNRTYDGYITTADAATEEVFWRLLEEQKPDLVCVAPALIHAMAREAIDARKMREIASGMIRGVHYPMRRVVILSAGVPPWNAAEVGADGFISVPARPAEWECVVSLLFPFVRWERDRLAPAK